MKTWILIAALASLSPVAAQSPAKPQAKRSDPCAPIGRTADGKLVYGMACENLPAPPIPLRAEAAAAAAPAPVEEEDRGGMFRNPFPSLIKPSDGDRIQGVGPSTGGR